MEKIFNKVCCLFSLFFFACSPSVENGIKIIGMGIVMRSISTEKKPILKA